MQDYMMRRNSDGTLKEREEIKKVGGERVIVDWNTSFQPEDFSEHGKDISHEPGPSSKRKHGEKKDKGEEEGTELDLNLSLTFKESILVDSFQSSSLVQIKRHHKLLQSHNSNKLLKQGMRKGEERRITPQPYLVLTEEIKYSTWDMICVGVEFDFKMHATRYAAVMEKFVLRQGCMYAQLGGL
ncbi:hypothetical protein DKX38_019203 [Salix brachista]|uniref:Uncharacterized protein n=1 Tax=Salix brachista TaxID=2182728 RepID=A0A5N5KFK0_9ROSI|nr:hypothetical protein DKX38_019203 [Salix brachista]